MQLLKPMRLNRYYYSPYPIRMSSPFLKPILYFFLIILPGWTLYRMVIWGRLKRNGKSVYLANELKLTLFVMYVGAVLAITIAPAAILSFNNPSAQKFNLIPFINTYKQYIDTLSEPNGISTRFALENIIGNFILFIPLGIFLPAIFKQLNSFKQVAIICFICSFAIELFQFILRKFGTYRTSDIDDVFLNTLGGIAGWLIYYAFIYRRKKTTS